MTDPIGWFEALVLGLIQGLTEFLPISSTGHLRVVPAFLGWDDPGAAFTAVTQLGTMSAVLWYFRADLWRVSAAWLAHALDGPRTANADARLGWFLLIGTLPIGVFGLTFDDAIRTVVRDLRVIAVALITLGVLLALVDRFAPRTRTLESLRWRDAIAVGFAQAAALIPGVSRSGATITMARALGLDRPTAARFSFLLSVPAVVLSGLYELQGIGEGGSPEWGPTIVATVMAFLSGYAAIAWLIRWLGSHSMTVFAVYRVGLGVAILVALSSGVIA